MIIKTFKMSARKRN
ncbi:hypothetical protein [Escherichia coli]